MRSGIREFIVLVMMEMGALAELCVKDPSLRTYNEDADGNVQSFPADGVTGITPLKTPSTAEVANVPYVSVFEYNNGVSLLNYNNSEGMQIVKDFYHGVSGNEWTCTSTNSENCSQSLLSQHNAVDVQFGDLCSTNNNNKDCIVQLSVNWTVNVPSIKYNLKESSFEETLYGDYYYKKDETSGDLLLKGEVRFVETKFQ